MANQKNIPLVELLERHIGKRTKSFHVPGHKNGLLYSECSDSLFAYDLTEISGLDDLHEPRGAILEAENLLAEAYHAGKSYWLVGGTTSGNLAMLSATLQRGDQVIVVRDAHKSILHGIELAGAVPIFLTPKVDEKLGVASGVDLTQLETALKKYPSCRACVFTYPSYYGTTFDIGAAIRLVHKYGKLALVDEAHGAHLAASSLFPESALDLGADVVVQSAHKTLPALTMGAFLHIHTNALELQNKLAYYLKLFQTSSPSYLVMASLDKARHYLANYNENDSAAFMEMKEIWVEWLTKQGVTCVFPDDPLKLVVRKTGYSGFELQQALEEKGYFTELADEQQVLLIFPLLKTGMRFLPEEDLLLEERESDLPAKKASIENSITELALDYAAMQDREEEWLALKKSIGRISAETIAVYPPGIPAVMRGERLTSEIVHQLERSKQLHRHGGKALADNKISVFCE